MIIGKVIGTCVATVKDSKLEGLKMLLVQPVSPKIENQGSMVVAIDSVGAGIGEVVLYASGSSARQTEATNNKPVDAVIMAIVDTLEVNNEVTFQKE
ncbi:MAG: EutN/CcmL family microcompartment protein [Oligoflexia bacterium]|nr:EutN/CcmL family microcompartment protein [Oligoflexia bacterium]